MIATFKGFSLWEQSGDWVHKWMSGEEIHHEGDCSWLWLWKWGVNHYKPKPPGDLHSTRKTDKTDINYLWLSSSVMLWNSLLIMFLVSGILFKGCTNSKITQHFVTCAKKCALIFTYTVNLNAVSHTCRSTNICIYGHILCINLQICMNIQQHLQIHNSHTHCIQYK